MYLFRRAKKLYVKNTNPIFINSHSIIENTYLYPELLDIVFSYIGHTINLDNLYKLNLTLQSKQDIALHIHTNLLFQ